MQAPTPLVSVLVPIFNHERYVTDALASARAAGYPRLELIAIDDGSTDRSYELADAWLQAHGAAFERWQLHRQDNVGVTRTMNRLVELSSGEFIFPLASDDLIAPDAVGKLLDHYRSYCRSPTLLFSDVALIGLAGELIAPSAAKYRKRRTHLLASSPEFLAFDVLVNWGTPFQHHFFPRALYDRIGGYDPSLKFEDLYLALRSIAEGCAAFAPVVSRYYRIRPGLSITPGFTADEIKAGPSRTAVYERMTLAQRMVIRILNRREREKGALTAFSIRAALFVLRRLTYWWYERKHRIAGPA